MRKKGFTLIELIVILMIVAILTLIVYAAANKRAEKPSIIVPVGTPEATSVFPCGQKVTKVPVCGLEDWLGKNKAKIVTITPTWSGMADHTPSGYVVVTEESARP